MDGKVVNELEMPGTNSLAIVFVSFLFFFKKKVTLLYRFSVVFRTSRHDVLPGVRDYSSFHELLGT